MMNISQAKVFCSDDTLSDDELDDFFSELFQMEPPPRLIEQILTSVKRLPLPQGQPGPEQIELATALDASDAPVVHHDHLPPS